MEIDSLIGKEFGGFVVESLIDSGHIGAVLKARNPHMEKDAAVKIFPSQYVAGKAKERFDMETKVLQELEHPNIVKITDASITKDAEGKDLPYIVMDYMKRGSLNSKMIARKGQPFSPEDVIDTSLRVLDALDYAHSKDIIHGDPHPGNVLFNGNDKAHLSDFELARLKQEPKPEDYSSIKYSLGQRKYPVPEVMEGGEYTSQADIYLWSSVMFELLTGKTHHKAPGKKIREINPEVPALLEEIVMQGLSEEPEDRFPVKEGTSAAAMRKALYKLTREGRGEEATRIIQGYEPRISSILERKVHSETLDVKDINDLYALREQLYTDIESYGISSDDAKKRASGIEKLIDKRREGDSAILWSYQKTYKKNVSKIKDGRRKNEMAEKLKHYIRVAHVWGFHKGECPVARGEV